ncbi:MAG: trypsin-like peptidase domain-containing protein [Planctomycetota bacterium]
MPSFVPKTLAAMIAVAASPAALGWDDATRPAADDRARSFRQLATDVAALEEQLGIYKRVARLVAPSVVHIEARPVSGYRTRSNQQEAGSGVVVRFRGKPYVLTNRHVIRRSAPTHIDVYLIDDAKVSPSRAWSDPETDVAVLELGDTPDEKLTPALLGDSADLEIGDQVMAFGSPFGLSHSVTRGIISAKGRYNLDLGEGEVALQNFLQTDAAINPGNSGGPLVNLRGEVVGLNTAIASNSGGNEGIGFSIPINLATRIAGQLIDSGSVARGYRGVVFDARFDRAPRRSPDLPPVGGAKVLEVRVNSPASRAALRPDDIVLSFDGVRVEDGDHLFNLVNLTAAGSRVEIELLRNGARIRATVPIGRRPADQPVR